jgi:hypothetical protein
MLFLLVGSYSFNDTHSTANFLILITQIPCINYKLPNYFILEHFYLMGCNVVLLGDLFPTFRKIVVSSTSGSKSEVHFFLVNSLSPVSLDCLTMKRKAIISSETSEITHSTTGIFGNTDVLQSTLHKSKISRILRFQIHVL